jgi:inner membrane protein
VHLAQYALVGIAQTVFYLLLLSFAEHLGFDLSFLIAGASTIALLSINADWVFHSRKLALRAFAVFTILYAFIYVLLRVEAYALLVGAITSFVAVAAAMYITRNVDWYGSGSATPSFASVPPTSASGPAVRESWLK